MAMCIKTALTTRAKRYKRQTIEYKYVAIFEVISHSTVRALILTNLFLRVSLFLNPEKAKV